MIGFLWRVIVGRFASCRHKWSQIERGDLVGHNALDVRGCMLTLRCEHCGDVTFRSWQT